MSAPIAGLVLCGISLFIDGGLGWAIWGIGFGLIVSPAFPKKD